MKKNVLVKTNIFICTVIIMGFLLTSFVSYQSNNGIYKKDIENISSLTSEGIYHKIDAIFIKPINISLTMANDKLLKTFLTEEEQRGNEEEFVQTMKDYLYAYKEKYNYDSVFLVSAGTSRYYHYGAGVDRILTRDNPENQWYYSFLQSPREYSLNIDNDEVRQANNEINIFINCKIFSDDGEIMGVVGVGFGVDTMQEMFMDYETMSQLRAYLVDKDGMIEISTTQTGYEKTDLFADGVYGDYQQTILSNREDTQSFWYDSGEKRGFLVSRYIPNLEWYLIIDNDTSALEASLYRQFVISAAVIILVILSVLLIITRIIKKYNVRIISLVMEKEKMHRTVFQTETEKLYENISEFDITHNRAANEATESYFESLGVTSNIPFDKQLQVIAGIQIKEEFREGYIRTFSPDNVLKVYEEGGDSLHYDFLITNNGGVTYYWMRVIARIFYWEEDRSVRMLTYRQNIDNEKRQELLMSEKMKRDSLSGLYNKAATQEMIRRLLIQNPGQMYAFFILDIDHFKNVNDTFGHSVGDQVIADFAGRIKGQFQTDDIVGRIGGDEFAVFIPVPSEDWAVIKAEALSGALQYDFCSGFKCCHITASIGVALTTEAGISFEALYQNADSALYEIKENGRNGYAFYHVQP